MKKIYYQMSSQIKYVTETYPQIKQTITALSIYKTTTYYQNCVCCLRLYCWIGPWLVQNSDNQISEKVSSFNPLTDLDVRAVYIYVLLSWFNNLSSPRLVTCQRAYYNATTKLTWQEKQILLTNSDVQIYFLTSIHCILRSPSLKSLYPEK